MSFKNNNDWLQHHPKNALLFADKENTWQKLKDTYNGDFKNLVFGDSPTDEKIFETLLSIKNRLATIEWEIKT